MLYNFKITSEDEKILSENEQSNVYDNIDYSKVVVKKPWGYEYLAFDNGQVAIWILHIARKRKTSFHSHPNKTTSLIVLSGSAKCKSLNKEVELSQLDCVHIDKGCFHSTEAHSDSDVYPTSENGVWIMEIESPSNKGDLVRLNDTYGRAGTSYESGRNLLSYEDKWLKLFTPAIGNKHSQSFMGCKFTIRNGNYKDYGNESNDSIIIPVGSEDLESKLEIGSMYSLKNILPLNKSSTIFLTIEKEKMFKLSDYVINYISSLGIKHVFSVCGGGAMHLVDSAGKRKDIEYVATHHEQAAAMAAEAYSRINGLAACLVTTGPGGTNAITGVAGAWVDSIPVVFISGQVTKDTLIDDNGLRQFGVQESNIVELVKPITKYSTIVKDEKDIRYELEKAFHIATSGRPGPVWLDIPLDVQSKLINPLELKSFEIPKERNSLKKQTLRSQTEEVFHLINESDRPVLIVGNGVRLAKAEIEILELVNWLGIPVVTSWTANDLIGDNSYHIGHCGIFGDRASNFAVQNADLLLVIGSRLSIPQIGYNYAKFARSAKIIMVDVDMNEMLKPSLHVDLPILADAKEFVSLLLSNKQSQNLFIGRPVRSVLDSWLFRCLYWKNKYPVVLPEYGKLEDGVNSFYFIDQLSKTLGDDATIVTDMGTSFTCTMQTFKTKLGQRLTTSSGHASMGFGLPGAIGACFANNKKQTICISGEGGLQMNIQELQTIVHHKLPIIIFVINNGGYLTIKHMQQNHFGKYVGSEESSGVSFPSMRNISLAYDIKYYKVKDHLELNQFLQIVSKIDGPFVCEIMMPEDQALIPRSSSLKRPDGTIVSKPLEDLYPFLDRDEFDKNMIIPQVNELE